MLPSYLKQAHGVVVVFDTTNEDSYKAIDTYNELLESNVSEKVPRLLVGTKSDKIADRKISEQHARARAKLGCNCTYIETSAKDDVNIDRVIQTLVSSIMTSLGYE